MATTAPATEQAKQLPAPTNAPRGVQMRPYWRPEPSAPINDKPHPVSLPVDEHFNLVGSFFACPVEECATHAWVFPPAAAPETRFCAKHGVAVEQVELIPTDHDPIAAAKWRLAARLRERLREQAQARYDAAKAAAEAKARKTYLDYKNHLPLAGAAAGLYTGSTLLVNMGAPLLSASIAVAVATAGAVVAYVVAYLMERPHILAVEEGPGRDRRAARARRVARRAAFGAMATSAYVLLATATGVDPSSVRGGIAALFAALLVWATCHRPWSEISQRRDSQREASRLAELAKQQAAVEKQEKAVAAALVEAEIAAAAPVDENDPLVVGQRMAARWQDIARSEFAQVNFAAMRHTWIVAEETKPVMVPIDGETVRVGWQYLIASKPGALVAVSDGSYAKPPIVAARGWLASMLEIPPSRIEMVDQPDSQVNRALMIIMDSERTALAGIVPWRGKEGIQRHRDGSIWAFIGRSLKGDDVYEPIYVPGQLSGGLTIGNPGGGKTIGTIGKVFNLIVAGGLPTLHDPKELVDYADLVGLFPIGVTPEHREVLLRWKKAERERRQKIMAKRRIEARERILAQRRGERVETPEGEIPGVFNTQRDGLLVGSYWEEFHLSSVDQKFMTRLATELRLERAVAMYDQAITQGGGLQDLRDSVLRGILKQLSLEVYRLPITQARLGGYRGTFDPDALPRIPGVLMREAEGAPATPMRMIYISPDPADEGSLFDVLLNPDGSFALEVAPMPEPMFEVAKAEGLIDLWNLGRGEHGLDNLLAGTSAGVAEYVTPAQAAGLVGQNQIDAKYVILALVHEQPGCNRLYVRDHSIWTERAGWAATPNPSTISRAIKELTGHNKEGERDEKVPVLLDKGIDGQHWRVTEAGAELAKQWVAELNSRTPVGAAVDTTSEGVDSALSAAQQAELDAELATEAREAVEEAYAESNH